MADNWDKVRTELEEIRPVRHKGGPSAPELNTSNADKFVLGAGVRVPQNEVPPEKQSPNLIGNPEDDEFVA